MSYVVNRANLSAFVATGGASSQETTEQYRRTQLIIKKEDFPSSKNEDKHTKITNSPPQYRDKEQDENESEDEEIEFLTERLLSDTYLEKSKINLLKF